MQCLVYLRILTLVSLCQPSLHIDRFENDRKSLSRENSYVKSPRNIRSDLSDLERENVEDESSNKRSFWSRPIAENQKRKWSHASKHRRNEPHSHERRTVPDHRSIESDEYRTRQKGKNQNTNFEYSAQELELHCGRKQRHERKIPIDQKGEEMVGKYRSNTQEEYLSNGDNEGFGGRKRSFRDKEEYGKLGNNRGHRRNVESETFLSGEESIQDDQKMLLDSFRRRKRTGENVGNLRRRRKKRKKENAEERKRARTNLAVYGNKGNADLAADGANSFRKNKVPGRNKQAFVRDYFRKRRKRRQIMDGGGFKGLRKQSEEGNQWEARDEDSDKDNGQEVDAFMNKGAGFETDDYGNEQESVGDETEFAEDEINSRKKKESKMEFSKRRHEIKNSKGSKRHSELCAIKTEGGKLGSQRNTENKKMQTRNSANAERRRWVYINNVYPYPNAGGQKIKPERVKPTPIGDSRRARRVHRKLPEVSEFVSDEDAVREEAEWDKEYAINDAEEADRDHRQAETMEAEAEVQEQEREKMGESEMDRELGPETEEERPGLGGNEREHKRLEKGSDEEAESASRHQRTNFETKVNRFIGNVESTNVASSPLLSSGTSKEDAIRWNVIPMLAFGLLVFA